MRTSIIVYLVIGLIIAVDFGHRVFRDKQAREHIVPVTCMSALMVFVWLPFVLWCMFTSPRRPE